MIYVDDCISATVQFLKADQSTLKRNVYNLAGISFSPEQLVEACQRLIPGFKVDFLPCPVRSKIADSWPRSLDDTYARQEWGHTYDISTYELAHKILSNIKPEYKVGKLLNMGNGEITWTQQDQKKHI